LSLSLFNEQESDKIVQISCALHSLQESFASLARPRQTSVTQVEAFFKQKPDDTFSGYFGDQVSYCGAWIALSNTATKGRFVRPCCCKLQVLLSNF